jgi:hypothetical protein
LKARALYGLTRLSLGRDRKSWALSVFGVAMGVGSLVFFVALGLGVNRVVRERIFPAEATLVDVVPAALSFGSVLGGGALDEATVQRLASLPGVEEVFRKQSVRVPAMSRYEGNFFGAPLRMAVDMVAVGVDRSFVAKDVKWGDFTDPGPGRPLPVVISRRLLDLYNLSFAPARKLPRLGPDMLLGFELPIEFNRSMVTPVAQGPVLSARLQIVGVSDHASLVAVTLPLEAARRINQATGQDGATLSGITLRAHDASFVPKIVDQVRAMGLRVEDQERRMSESAGLAVLLATSALAFVSLLICVLAAVNVAQTLLASVRARERELGVMRAVGASRRDIRTLIQAEAVVLGVGGGALGTVAAVGLGAACDALARRLLPGLPFSLDGFFVFPWTLVGGGIALGIGAAVLGAYVPSRHASAVDPARALA